MAIDIAELERRIEEVRITAEDALDKFPLRSTTTAGAGRERHIHDLGKHPGGVIAARAHHSAAISIPNNSETVITTLDSERYDTDTIHDTSSNTGRLTCKTAGKYIIIAQVNWNQATGGRRILSILLNGTTLIGRVEIGSAAGGTGFTPAQTAATVYDLAVDDFVEMRVFQDSGGALNVRADSNFSPEFMMSRIGAAGTSGGGAPGRGCAAHGPRQPSW